MKKLESCGVSGLLQEWIRNWLNGRRQRVVINGSYSGWETVLSGVPQGSVLGPILFLIFINDLSDGVMSLLSIFADDTKLISSVKNEKCIDQLQKSIYALQQWAKRWGMRFNASKCAVMHLGTNNPCHQYYLEDHRLEVTHQEKDIGVIVQDNGKVNEQCKKVALTCNRIIGQISRSFTNRTPDLMIKIYKCYILPHVEYDLSVWSPHLQKDIKTLEAIQRRFTRLISGMRNRSYEERLAILGLPTLEARRLQKDLVQCYRIWTGIDHIEGLQFTKLS